MRLGLLAAALLLGATSVGAAEIDTRSLTVEQNSVVAVQPTSPGAAAIRVRTDRAHDTYRLGEPVSLFVTADRDSYFTVIDIGPSGHATLLYPNGFQPATLIKAGEILAIPGKDPAARVIAKAPAGVELIRVIATPTSLSPLALSHLGGVGAFKSIDGGIDALVRDLTVTAAKRDVSFIDKAIHTVAQDAPAPTTAPTVPVNAAPGGAGVMIAADRPFYKLGQKMNLAVTTLADCYLWVIDLDAAGGRHVLFPNQIVQDNHIGAMQTALLSGGSSPVAVVATAPAGQDTIFALCSNNPKPDAIGELDYSEMFPPLDPKSPLVRALEDTAQSRGLAVEPTVLADFNWAELVLTTF